MSSPAVTLSLLRSDLVSRTPSLPASLRDKLQAIAEENRPAQRTRRRPQTTWLGLGYTGGLLAAFLALATGVVYYLESGAHHRTIPMRAEAPPSGDVLAVVVGQAAARLLAEGSHQASWEMAGDDPRLAQALAHRGWGRGLTLAGERPPALPWRIVGAAVCHLDGADFGGGPSPLPGLCWGLTASPVAARGGGSRETALVVTALSDAPRLTDWPDQALWQSAGGLWVFGQRRRAAGVYFLTVGADRSAVEVVGRAVEMARP